MEGAGDVNVTASSVTHRAIPEIRIRKGSDAPSIGEIKGTAPLASIESEGLSEGTSDIDDIDTVTLKDNTELFTTTDSSVFFTTVDDSVPEISGCIPEEYNADSAELGNGCSIDSQRGNSTDTLSMDNVKIVENDDRYANEDRNEQEGDITPCASPSPPPENDEKLEIVEDISSWPAPPSKSPSLEGNKDFTPDSGLDDNFDTEDSENIGNQAEEQEVEEEPEDTVSYEPLDNEEGGDDPFDLSYIEKKYAKDVTESSEVNPIETSAINLGDLDNFLADTYPASTEDTTLASTSVQKSPEKITISIPNFKKRPKSPSRDKEGDGVVNGVDSEKSEGIAKPIKGPPRPPPPSTCKPGRPPPPKSRPPPPKQGPQNQWETFEPGSTSSPKRPPPPKKVPKRGKK